MYSKQILNLILFTASIASASPVDGKVSELAQYSASPEAHENILAVRDIANEGVMPEDLTALHGCGCGGCGCHKCKPRCNCGKCGKCRPHHHHKPCCNKCHHGHGCENCCEHGHSCGDCSTCAKSCDNTVSSKVVLEKTKCCSSGDASHHAHADHHHDGHRDGHYNHHDDHHHHHHGCCGCDNHFDHHIVHELDHLDHHLDHIDFISEIPNNDIKVEN